MSPLIAFSIAIEVVYATQLFCCCSLTRMSTWELLFFWCRVHLSSDIVRTEDSNRAVVSQLSWPFVFVGLCASGRVFVCVCCCCCFFVCVRACVRACVCVCRPLLLLLIGFT